MLSINISELIWGIINFFLLFFLLRRFLFNPLISFTEKRKERIDRGFEAEKQAMEEKERTEADIRTAQERSRAQARQLVSQAGAESARLHEQLLTEAARQASAEQKRFDDELEGFCAQAQSQLSAHRAKLASALADRLLQG